MNYKTFIEVETLNAQLMSIFESIMIVTALSTDAFIASFAYGTNKVKIPFSSVTVINVVCSSILAVSLFLGSVIKNIIPESITHVICFTILFVLGTYKLLGSILDNKAIRKKIKFNFLGLNIETSITSIDEEKNYDVKSKMLMPMEAASLSIALSLDGLAVGVGAALVNSNSVQIVLFSLISDMVAVMLGCFLGNKVAEKISFNLSWLSGVLLLTLSFMKL